MTKSSVCGVHVQTWGPNYFSSWDGFRFYLNAILYGGNIGHASITLTIPANSASEQMIQKYCSLHNKPLIPYELKTVRLANGAEEQVYEIYFSWWPSGLEGAHNLEDKKHDQLEGRQGFDFPWSEQAAEIFQPESRLYKGVIGRSRKIIGPTTVTHEKDLSPEDVIILQKTAENIRLKEQLEAIHTLHDKLQNKYTNQKLSKTESLLVWNALHVADSSALSASELLECVREERKKIQDQFAINIAAIEGANNATIENGATPLSKAQMDDYLTLGTTANGSVYLPIRKFPQSDIGTSNGLNAEAMLKEMHRLVTEHKYFDLYGKNCSETIGRILKAGVQQPHLKAYVDSNALGPIPNPQLLNAGAMRLQEGIIRNEHSTWWHSITNFLPIQNVMNKLIKGVLSSQSSIGTRLVCSVGLVFVLPIAAVAAAISWAVKAAFKAITQLEKSKLIASDVAREKSELGQFLDSMVVEINDPDPIKALKKFAETLEQQQDRIPVLSATTHVALTTLSKQYNSIPPELAGFNNGPIKANNLLELAEYLQTLAIQRVQAMASDNPETPLVLSKSPYVLSFSTHNIKNPEVPLENASKTPSDTDKQASKL